MIIKGNSMYHRLGIVVMTLLAVAPVSLPQTSPLLNQKKLDKIITIGIAPINFDCYDLTAGGIREYDDSLSTVARANICNKIRAMVSAAGFTAKVISYDTSNSADLKAMRRFYDVVNNEIRMCVFSDNPLPGARRMFSYTLPPIEGLCESLGVDAILLVNGFDDASTPRRRQLKAGAVAGAIAGAVMAAFIGFGGYTVIPPDYTIMSAALINKPGHFAWYNSNTSTGYNDMADTADVSENVSTLLYRLSKGYKEHAQ